LWTEPVVVQCQVHNGEQMSNAVDFAFNNPGATRADPDDLEEDIDEAIDNDEIKPLHRSRHPRKKKK
jgi:hypothetical protein